MKVVKLRPFVPSGEDFALAQRFFEELGFHKRYADTGLCLFQVGVQEFYLQNLHNQELQDQFMVELVVEDLEAWWAHIREAELERKYPIRVKEPTLYPWGKRELHLIDPAGVCWHLSEAKQEEDVEG